MNLFDDIINEVRDFLLCKKDVIISKEIDYNLVSWPKAKGKNLVLASDMAVELGNPRQESVAFMIWTQNPDLVKNGVYHLIGPDLPNAKGQSLPFGKVVMLKVSEMDENNCYKRHQSLEFARYDLDLEGYMLRAASQYLREWSRVSNQAIEKGFSFSVLAVELSRLYRMFDFVEGIECLFITSSCQDVRALSIMGQKVEKRIAAMNRMAIEMNFDCDQCEYVEVCTEVEGLRILRNRPKEASHENRIF